MSRSVLRVLISKPSGNEVFIFGFWAQDLCWHHVIVSPLYRTCSHHTSPPSSVSVWPCRVQLCLPPHLYAILPSKFPLWKHADWQLHFKDLLPLRCYGYHLLSGAVETEGEQGREWEPVPGSRLCCGANLDDWPWNASWNGLPCVPLKWPVPGSVM